MAESGKVTRFHKRTKGKAIRTDHEGMDVLIANGGVIVSKNTEGYPTKIVFMGISFTHACTTTCKPN